MLSLETVLAVVVLIGIAGSAIEKAGLALENERVVNIGKAIESVTADLPKFVTNIFALFSGKKTS